ncbi:MAG TPA: bifunctional oligoribonuclease/PAP phosphatase NrnA [Acidimicrobiales bacterium]|nr:bifunctional oligoribonuclease/PAP phosphatase NrnA [Acidimicrobiales bacterium]
MTSSDLDRAAAAIHAADSVALACHVAPDGDALGSMLGLHHLCLAHGKPSIASWPAPFVVAPHYAYLPGLEIATPPEEFPTAPDVMITFDCGSLARLGELGAAAVKARELIVLDHHLSNDRYGTINVIDIDAAATAVVVRRLADRLGWSLTRDAAMCLYTGLVTDTGRFQYQSTTPEVFALAEELARFDLPIPALSRQLFEEHRLAYLKLAGACLARAELDERDGFVMAWVTADELLDNDVTIEETEGLIDLVRRTKEAEVSAVLKETPEGIRVSLRSVTEVDVSAVAAGFGGGGHRYAAGFTSTASLESVKAALREAVAVAVKAVAEGQ